MSDDVILLGVAPAGEAEALSRSLASVPGPALVVQSAAGLSAIAQGAGGLLARALGGLKRELGTLQRRLELACQNGPFLPADPAAARLAQGELGTMLAADAQGLAECLSHHGNRHQWEVVLRWNAEAVLAPRRAAIEAELRAAGGSRDALAGIIAATLAEVQHARAGALAQALRPVVVAQAPAASASETETRLTALIERDTERLIEGALAGLPAEITEGASADLRGPMPPVAFAAIRVVRPDPAACTRAWDSLGLPTMIEAAELPAFYRRIAFALHPDRQAAGETGASGEAMADVAQAYRLLRSITATHRGALARSDLVRLARPRLAIPALAVLEAEGQPA